jgi:hypothetical protein
MNQPPSQPIQLPPNFRYYNKDMMWTPPQTAQKPAQPKYIPTEDGFITSSGNPVLAAKYGNIIGANTITVKDLIDSTKK